MKAKILSAFSLVLGFLGFSQTTTEVYFKYDEAGNQRYRGTNISARQAAPDKTKAVSSQKEDEKDKKFWEGVKIYPVPVKDILTLEWTDENNALIENVSLYEHNRVDFVFQQKNIPNINKQVQVDMSKMYMGVYVLSFQLKDGKVISRNIIRE